MVVELINQFNADGMDKWQNGGQRDRGLLRK